MKKKMLKNLTGLVLISGMIVLAACGTSSSTTSSSNSSSSSSITPTDSFTDLTKRDALGEYGMVTSASAYASKAGYDILKAGGNAFDAAVAVAYALNVTEPNASGVGGGGLFVGYDATKKEAVAYNYREFAPGGATPARYGVGDINLSTGAGSSGIPMFVDGTLTVLENHGTMTRQEVLAPAIKLARDGFLVPPTLAYVINDNFATLMKPEGKVDNLETYTDMGIPLEEGSLLVNKNLANTLSTISEKGKEGFYKGNLANAMVTAMNESAGPNSIVFTMADMNRAIGLTQKLEPQEGTYRDYDIISIPPGGGGIAVIEALNLVEAYSKAYGDIKNLQHNSSEYLHVVASALQLALNDRSKYLADPNFVEVPTYGITSKKYAEKRWKDNFDQSYGKTHIGFGDPWEFNEEPPVNQLELTPADESKSHSTTHISVVDKFGNIVSTTQTINSYFGCAVVPKGTGIHMNNELNSFSTSASSASVIAPYKIPLSSMSPTLFLKDGNPVLTLGSPGSQRIISAILQVSLNVLDFGFDIQTAIEKPRIFNGVGMDLEIEKAMPSASIQGLKDLGYKVQVKEGQTNGYDIYFGGVQGITFNNKTKIMHGGADRRRDGKALGY